MVGSIAIHMVQQEGYSVIDNSPLTEVAIVTLLFQDGVGYYSFLQVAHRIFRISTLQDVLHGVFTLLDIVRATLLRCLCWVLMLLKQAGTCIIILVHLGIFLVGGVGYSQKPGSLHIAFAILHSIQHISFE